MTLEDRALAVLTVAKPYPVTIDHLRRTLGIPRREAEAVVEALRLDGQPIVAGNDGLRLTDDPDELDSYVQARRRRLVSIYAGCRTLRRTARAMRERTELTLW